MCQLNQRADWICIPKSCWPHPAKLISNAGRGCNSELGHLTQAPQSPASWSLAVFCIDIRKQAAHSPPKGQCHPKWRTAPICSAKSCNRGGGRENPAGPILLSSVLRRKEALLTAKTLRTHLLQRLQSRASAGVATELKGGVQPIPFPWHS